MKFVCDRCQTRYSIADEKVRQKILRIRCKTCGNVIVVQGESATASGGEAGAHGAKAPEHFESANTDASSSPKTVPPSASKSVPSSHPKAAPSSAPKAAPAGVPKPGSANALKAPLSSSLKAATAAPKAGPAGPPPPPPAAVVEHDPLGGRVEWYLAIGGVRSGPFSRAGAAQKILSAASGTTVHVWKEGMPGWKPSDEVSVIARELSILRPPPPPPPPPERAKTPMPMSSSPPKVAAMPPAVAKAAKAQAPEAQSLFPGKPLTPAPASMSDAMDLAVDTNPGAFADITTKKAKRILDLANEPGKGSFADVTTKKNKNLRELEAEPLFATAPAFAEADRTPPPVHPLPTVAAKAAEPAHPSSSSTNLPVAMRVSSTNLPVAVTPSPFKAPAASPPSLHAAPASAPPGPFVVPAAAPPSPSTSPATPATSGIASAATSSPAMPAASAVVTAQADVGSFSDVIRAVAESDQPAEQAFPTPLTPTDYSTFPPQISPESKISKVLARPGLKYLVAACAIVVLVILIVMVTLRMDTRKVVEPEPTPSQATEPVAAEPPKPVAAEEPKPEPVIEEKPSQGTRGSGKHGSGKSSRRMDVGPAPERQATQKKPAGPVLVARPNPFDESKTVSQSQISAVVRNKANQSALKSCYERALKMDNHLTSGRIDVTVSIGTSGSVQRVVVNAPSSFILVEPCIKSAVHRWVFPPNIEEYATNFPLIMQGGM